MSTEEGMDLLVIGDDDLLHTDVAENEDYIIVHDPSGEENESLCVLILTGDYKDFVIRYENVGLDTKSKELSYSYTLLTTGTDEELHLNELDFTNYLTSILNRVMIDLHEAGAQGYVDLETGKELTY